MTWKKKKRKRSKLAFRIHFENIFTIPSFHLKKKKSRILTLLENFRCTKITATKKEEEKKKHLSRFRRGGCFEGTPRRERERETLGGQVKNDCKIIDDCQPFLNPKRASRYVYTHDTDTRTRSSRSLHVRLIVVTGRGKRQRVSKIMAVHLFSRVGRARSYDDSGTNYLRLRINRLLSSESFPN